MKPTRLLFALLLAGTALPALAQRPSTPAGAEESTAPASTGNGDAADRDTEGSASRSQRRPTNAPRRTQTEAAPPRPPHWHSFLPGMLR